MNTGRRGAPARCKKTRAHFYPDFWVAGGVRRAARQHPHHAAMRDVRDVWPRTAPETEMGAGVSASPHCRGRPLRFRGFRALRSDRRATVRAASASCAALGPGDLRPSHVACGRAGPWSRRFRVAASGLPGAPAGSGAVPYRGASAPKGLASRYFSAPCLGGRTRLRHLKALIAPRVSQARKCTDTPVDNGDIGDGLLVWSAAASATAWLCHQI
jgi:hypothetical protein